MANNPPYIPQPANHPNPVITNVGRLLTIQFGPVLPIFHPPARPVALTRWRAQLGWDNRTYFDYLVNQSPGFIFVVAGDKQQGHVVLDARERARYLLDRNGRHQQCNLVPSTTFNPIDFRRPLGFCQPPNQRARLCKQAYDFHLLILAYSHRFYFYDCKDLYWFLIHLTKQARAALRSVTVEFLTDDVDGEDWTTRAATLLAEECFNLEEFNFGFCGLCREGRCADSKWNALMQIRGIQRTGIIHIRRARPGRNCSECRKPQNAGRRGFARSYDIHNRVFDRTNIRHRHIRTRYSLRIKDLRQSLRRRRI